jgi:hypothetical protein
VRIPDLLEERSAGTHPSASDERAR